MKKIINILVSITSMVLISHFFSFAQDKLTDNNYIPIEDIAYYYIDEYDFDVENSSYVIVTGHYNVIETSTFTPIMHLNVSLILSDTKKKKKNIKYFNRMEYFKEFKIRESITKSKSTKKMEKYNFNKILFNSMQMTRKIKFLRKAISIK